MDAASMLERLQALANPANVAGMARFGINPQDTLGISMERLRVLGREIGRDHMLAGALWESGVHEARLLASLIDDPRQVSSEQMERWVADFDSWDVCDQCCINLFRRTPWAYEKAVEWASRPEEFVKRAGFVLMATLGVHDKKVGDPAFLAFLVPIVREAGDERNFVKKAINWALRQIGKRNSALNAAAIAAAQQIAAQGSRPARWIAADALRELTGPAVQERLTKAT